MRAFELHCAPRCSRFAIAMTARVQTRALPALYFSHTQQDVAQAQASRLTPKRCQCALMVDRALVASVSIAASIIVPLPLIRLLSQPRRERQRGYTEESNKPSLLGPLTIALRDHHYQQSVRGATTQIVR